jgi:GNAT superfamily N-acetyltransferase
MSDMDVRRAIPADFPTLAHLMTELGYPTSTDEIETRMAAIQGRADYAIFVADAGGRLAGMIGVSILPSLYQSSPNGAIVALVVSSEFRGQGVGALLVDCGEQWLHQNGAKRATVNPSTGRAAAHRFYDRLGYEHTGLRLTKTLGRMS